MRFFCRCSRKACQARRTLTKHPDEYVRAPKCVYCGNNKWRVDRWRKKNERDIACKCQGYHYPHRPGSPECQYEKDWKPRCPF